MMREAKTIGSGRATLLLALVILLWGCNWPIMKVGLQSMPPLTFAFARTALGALSLAALLLAMGRLRLPPRGDLPVLLSVGLLQVGVFLGLTHVALLYVEAGRSAILAYTTPLWVAPLSWVLLGEAADLSSKIALSLGLAGIAVLFNPLALNYHNSWALIGNGMLVCAAILWATTIVHVRAHRWHATPLELMPWQMAIGAMVLLPLAAIFDRHVPVRWSSDLLVILVYNGPVASAFCYWAFVTVNRSFRATTTALGSLGVPVVGMLAAAWTLHEPLGPSKIAGLVLIGCGVAALAISSSPRHAERARRLAS